MCRGSVGLDELSNSPHKHFDIVFTVSLLAICTASGSENETTEVCTAQLSARQSTQQQM